VTQAVTSAVRPGNLGGLVFRGAFRTYRSMVGVLRKESVAGPACRLPVANTRGTHHPVLVYQLPGILTAGCRRRGVVCPPSPVVRGFLLRAGLCLARNRESPPFVAVRYAQSGRQFALIRPVTRPDGRALGGQAQGWDCRRAGSCRKPDDDPSRFFPPSSCLSRSGRLVGRCATMPVARPERGRLNPSAKLDLAERRPLRLYSSMWGRRYGGRTSVEPFVPSSFSSHSRACHAAFCLALRTGKDQVRDPLDVVPLKPLTCPLMNHFEVGWALLARDSTT